MRTAHDKRDRSQRADVSGTNFHTTYIIFSTIELKAYELTKA